MGSTSGFIGSVLARTLLVERLGNLRFKAVEKLKTAVVPY